jgi:hypothetical protein
MRMNVKLNFNLIHAIYLRVDQFSGVVLMDGPICLTS